MTDPFTETLTSEAPPDRLRRGDGRRLNAGTQATALTAALSLVLVGGVATAAYRSFQGSRGPATLVPSTAFAFASMDLSLPGGQSDALGTFAGHFPGSPTRTGHGSPAQRLIRAMLHDSSDPQVNYDSDIKPWLGDHVAVAGWLDGDHHPQVEFLLQSRDDASARSHLDKLIGSGSSHLSLVMSEGYAVLAPSTTLAETALKDAKASALADNATFKSDLAALPQNEAAVGWVDGPGAKQAIESAVGAPLDQLMRGSGMLGVPFTLNNAFGGRLAVGLHVTGDYVQLDARTVGRPASTAARSSLLTGLPSGTIAGLEIGDPSATADQVTKLVGVVGAVLGGADSMAGCSIAVGPAGIPPASAFPPGTPHRRMILRQLARARKQARQQNARPPTPNACGQTKPAPPVDPLARLRTLTGLSLPGDLKTMLGDGAVVAYGGLNVGGPPNVGVRSHPFDIGQAVSLADTLQTALASKTGFQLSHQQAGDDLVVATSSAYASSLAQNGGLGDEKGFNTAMGNVPDQVSSAGYADLSRIWPSIDLLGGGVPAAVHHLKAIGFWSARDGAAEHLQLRVVAS